jgi:hypothetical protein
MKLNAESGLRKDPANNSKGSSATVSRIKEAAVGIIRDEHCVLFNFMGTQCGRKFEMEKTHFKF